MYEIADGKVIRADILYQDTAAIQAAPRRNTGRHGRNTAAFQFEYAAPAARPLQVFGDNPLVASRSRSVTRTDHLLDRHGSYRNWAIRGMSVGGSLTRKIEVFIGDGTVRPGWKMSHVSTTDLLEDLKQGDRSYLEVLNEESMSVELARYPNPAPKTPHREDELYFVISGSGMASVGDETYAIEEGDVIYVERGVEHDFFDIEEEVVALIVFAGSEESVLGGNS